jgi:hypothetical protein
MGNRNIDLPACSIVPQPTTLPRAPAIKRVDFVSDRMWCIILKGRWCDIVLNVHATEEDETDDKDSFY